MTDLEKPWKVLHRPGGYLLAPEEQERAGDVSNVLFSNGLVVHRNVVYLYYASSDTRMHVATAPLGDLVDWVIHTPEDPLFTGRCVEQRLKMIRNNLHILKDF
jgi:4-O-beta-D-mannosyl-D-glucose phosphorylase